ncbi:MAG: TIGR01906 family membrane protein [Anaerolineae bacterium]
MRRPAPGILRLIIVVAVPVVLTMTAVRILTLPWYPAWAYEQPGFPDDPLGMPHQERLRLARAAIRYLNVRRGSGLLRDLRLPDGSRAFNERELEHMDDVKVVYDRLTLLAVVLLGGAIAAGLGSALWGESCEVWRALAHGGGVTLVILLALGLWMSVGFGQFFTFFHGLFFESGTWVFRYSDTLIRLFPLPFWQYAGLMIAGAVSLTAIVLLAAGMLGFRRCLAAT